MNRRDIELLISARDTTGRTFQQVTANIAQLNAKIEEQVAAALKGEGSLQELRKAQEALAQAGRDLSALQGQIDAYEKLAANNDKAAAAAEAAKKKLDDFRATLVAGAEVTATQENKLQRLEVAVTKTSAALEKNRADLAAQVAVLDRAGVSTQDLARSQSEIVSSARQIGAGLVQANGAIESYAINLAEAKDKEARARRQATDAQRLEEAEQRVILARETQDLAEAKAARTALFAEIAAAERQYAAQDAFDQKIAQARKLGDAAQFVRLFAEATQTAAVAENQLSALEGYRAVGSMAVEASRSATQLVAAQQGVVTSSQEVAAGLRAILQPGAEAIRTLDGLEAAIAQTGVIANAEKGSVASYSNALNELSAQAAQITQQGALIDSFKSQAAATDAARAKFQQAQTEVERLGKAMAQADAPVEALNTDLKIAQANLNEATAALVQQETKLGQLSRGLKTAKIDASNLTVEEQRLAEAARQVAAASTNANKVLGRGGQKATGLFGLNPYELQNLGYQINDIVVSLASGQRPLTVLTQQGLQISQLFPGLISNVGAFIVANTGLIVALGLTAGAFVALGAVIANYNEDVARVNEFQQALALVQNTGGNTAQSLADLSEKLQILGLTAAEAKATILAFVEEGLDPARVAEYSQAAKDLSDRLGIDLVAATNDLISVQQGGFESVLNLTEKTHDLTDAELDHAQALYDAGRAAEARQYVLDRVAEKNRAIAEATQSQWTPAVNNLKTAFSNLLNFLSIQGGSILDTLLKQVNNVVLGFTYVTALLAGKGTAGALADARAVFDRQNNRAPSQAPGAGAQSIRDRRYKEQLDTEYKDSKLLTAEERRRNAVIDARRKAQKAGVSQTVEDLAATKALAKVNAEIAKEQETAANKSNAAGKRAKSARDKAAREAESLANKQANAQRELAGQLRSLDSAQGRGSSATLEDRLRIVDNQYQSIFDTIAKLRSLGINKTADGVDLETVKAQVEASKTRLKNETSIKFYQEQAALLEKQRSDEIARVQDAQARGAISVKDALAQATEINARLSPQIVGAANKALEIARSIAGSKPSPEMVSLIASLERIATGEGTNNIVGKVGLGALDDQSGKLDKLIKERDDLVKSYQVLNELGLKTDAETRALTVAAYAQQADAIKPVVDSLRQTVELLHQQIDPLTNLPVLTDTAYATWIAKLEAVNAGLVKVDDRVKQVNDAAQNAIAQGITNAFNTAGSAIAGLITGTKSFGDAIGDVFNAALSLVGDFLDAIAQVLIKMVALQVAQQIIGGSTGGLGGLFFHDGGVVGVGGASVRSNRSYGSWLGAPKFHNGGGLGLKPDEYKAVLKRGEEVLTETDPRHISNVGRGSSGGGQSAPSIKQVLLLDPEQVTSAMQTRSGQKAVLTVIRANKETIKQVLK